MLFTGKWDFPGGGGLKYQKVGARRIFASSGTF